MERMWMNLTEFLVNKRSFKDKLTILHDVACGLCYIHNKNIIHCDLTGNNILLTNNSNARIVDFGKAVTYDPNSNNELPTYPGNVHHMPPEASEHQYSSKLDIFSFGCVIIHTVTQEFPISNFDKCTKTSNVGSYSKVSEVDRRLVFIQKLKCDPNSAQLHKIVLECLQDHPDSRPTATVLHTQLKKCMKEYPKPDVNNQSKVTYKNITCSNQKRVKYYRSLYGLRQKRYKLKYKVYKVKNMKYVQDMHRVSVTESVASGSERYFDNVKASPGRLLAISVP